ncbi:BMC domain-containing protein [Peribacillus acanthi]|uniref:BMC domain-containing protein n=1 Tax=Peribacillus acanthi TaxID=2171554 RepID=UPI000D3E992E|nr:BMC domain-containing protein [Peribacillus acanthi]
MDRSVGLLEVIGTATAMACIDSMVKSAFVEVISTEKTGSGMITIIIEGDLASVKAAIERGEEVASSKGGAFSANVIARPYLEMNHLLLGMRRGEE